MLINKRVKDELESVDTNGVLNSSISYMLDELNTIITYFHKSCEIHLEDIIKTNVIKYVDWNSPQSNISKNWDTPQFQRILIKNSSKYLCRRDKFCVDFGTENTLDVPIKSVFHILIDKVRNDEIESAAELFFNKHLTQLSFVKIGVGEEETTGFQIAINRLNNVLNICGEKSNNMLLKNKYNLNVNRARLERMFERFVISSVMESLAITHDCIIENDGGLIECELEGKFVQRLYEDFEYLYSDVSEPVLGFRDFLIRSSAKQSTMIEANDNILNKILKEK